MVFVKGGCFEMGDSFGDGGADERPVHKVCLTDYYINKYPVTVKEFKAFTEETGYETEAERNKGCQAPDKEGKWIENSDIDWEDPGFTQTDNDPVVCISWHDANEFVKWRSKRDNGHYRLPTEAEWEYAARSRGKRYKYSWGNGEPSGNVADESLKKSFPGTIVWEGYNDRYVYTSPVGSFRPNELGLYDMSGNVWEWTADWYDENYYKKSQKDNPTGPKEGVEKVFRGGSWSTVPWLNRVTARGWDDPGTAGIIIGFRLAGSPK